MVEDGGSRCRVCFVDDQLRADRPDPRVHRVRRPGPQPDPRRGLGRRLRCDSSAWLAHPASPSGAADRWDSADSSCRVCACSRGCCWSEMVVLGARGRNRRRLGRPARAASGAPDVPRAGAAPGADDARARSRCRFSISHLCLADGLGQRRDLPPADAVSNGLHHWTVMTALAFLVLLLVLLAAARTLGWRIPAISASIAAGAWAISCLLAPTSAAGSEGHAWAWAALVWSVVTLAATVGPRTRDQTVTAEVQLQAT